MQITQIDINNHVEEILLLMEKLNYITAANITIEERRRLYNFFFQNKEVTSAIAEFNKSVINDESYDKMIMNELNRKLYGQMDESIKEIIKKCGVNPQMTYVFNQKGTKLIETLDILKTKIHPYSVYQKIDEGFNLDEKLSDAIDEKSYANAKDYIVIRTDNGAKSNDDNYSINYSVCYRKYDLNYHKFLLFEPYRHYNDPVLGDKAYCKELLELKNNPYNARYGEFQIYGPKCIDDYRFSIKSGMMKFQEKIAQNISDIMTTFYCIETNLKYELKSIKKRKRENKNGE